MSDTTNAQFKLVVPITGFTIRKSTKDGQEKYVLTGLASNTNIDLHGQRMAKSAIIAMAKSAETNPVMLNNEHGQSWDDDFGEVTKLQATDSAELMMEAELDPDHYRTQTLIKALKKGKKLGLSIGGVVNAAAEEFVAELGRKVMTFKDVTLFHVAVTGTPAVTDTWVTPITKSLKDWKEMPMSDLTHKTDEVVEEATDEVVETPAAEDAETPVVEEEAVVTDAPTDQRPADGDEPEATEDEPTPSSDSDDADEVADETTDPETANPPAEPEAPAQEDESPASEEAAPETADEGTSEEEAEAEAPAEEEAEKSATDTNSEVETIKKSLAEVQEQIATLTKSLSEKGAELETVTAELEEKAGELETTTAELEDATNKLEELEALEKKRKAKAFDGFEVEKSGSDKPASTSVESAWLTRMSSLDHQ